MSTPATGIKVSSLLHHNPVRLQRRCRGPMQIRSACVSGLRAEIKSLCRCSTRNVADVPACRCAFPAGESFAAGCVYHSFASAGFSRDFAGRRAGRQDRKTTEAVAARRLAAISHTL
jgi:hypothetical protein